MSYSFNINFMDLQEKEPLEKCKEVIALMLKYSEEMIWKNRTYIPSIESAVVSYSPQFRTADQNWLYNLFTINSVYWPERNLLGIIGNLPTQAMKIVTPIHFQSSSNRDYNYEIWNVIEYFETTVKNIREMDSKSVYDGLNPSKHEWYSKEELEENLEHYKKILIYDTIFRELQLFRWLDNEPGNFQVFSMEAITCQEDLRKLQKQINDIRSLYLEDKLF